MEVAKRSLGGVAALVAAARKQKTRACERENQEKKPKNSAEEIGGESPDWLREAAGLQVVRLPAFLGSRRNAPMDNSAVEGWLDLVSQRITGPLGMNDTFLIAIPNQQPRLAAGYAQALAKGDGGGRR